MQLGPYEVVEELGRGAMGVVYRGRHVDLGTDVALKVVAGAPSVAALERLRREAQAAARLADVPGIVGVHDTGETDGQRWFAMDFVAGRGLDELAREGELPPRQACALMASVARAVHRAHEAGVLHRDLKPSNIMVDVAGSPHVTDFGLAAWRDADPDVTRLTRSGELLGTPAYMAPEQALGRADDPRIDIYALGATLFDVLSGAPPFESESIHGLIHQVIHRPAPTLTSVGIPASVRLEAVLQHCLAKDPGDRYATADELADDLERHLAGQRVLARAPGLLRRVGRWVRARRVAVAVGAISVVAGLALGGWWMASRARTGVSEAEIEAAVAQAARITLAQQLPTAWHALNVGTLTQMRRLEGHRRGVTLSYAEQNRLLGEIRAVADRQRIECAATRLPDAWLGLAEIYLDRGDRGLARLREAVAGSPDDPLPRVLLAWGALADWVARVHVPGASFDAHRTYVDPFQEPAALVARRTEAHDALREIESMALWADVPQAQEVLEFVEGAQALAGGRYGEAATRMAAAADVPLLAGGAIACAALAHLLAGAHLEAARAYESLVSVYGDYAREKAAQAWVSVAVAADPEAAAQASARALALYRECTSAQPAIRLRRGCDMAVAHFQIGVATASQGGDPTPHWAAAEAESRAAIAGRVQLRLAIGLSTLITWARAARAPSGSEEALALLEAAVALTERFAPNLRGDPDSLARMTHGQFLLGQHLAGQARDARPILQQAIAGYEAEIARNPKHAAAHEFLCKTLWLLARQQQVAGQDGVAALERAERAAMTASELEWNGGAAALLAADVCVERGRAAARSGADAAWWFDRAISVLDRDTFAPARQASRHLVRGLAKLYAGEAIGGTGPARVAALESAIDEFGRAVALDPAHARGNRELGNGLRIYAALVDRRQADPEPFVVRSQRAFDRAVELNPRDPRALAGRAQLHLERATRLRRQRQSAIEPLSAAIADLQACLAVGGRSSTLYLDLGDCLRRRAENLATLRQPAIADVDASVQAYREAVKTPALQPAAWYGRASVRVLGARLLRAAGRSPRPHLEAAITDFDRYIERLPDRSDARHYRADARRLLGTLLGDTGRVTLEMAERELRELLAARPRELKTLASHAMCLEHLARVAEAITAWKRVLAVAPGHRVARRRVEILSSR